MHNRALTLDEATAIRTLVQPVANRETLKRFLIRQRGGFERILAIANHILQQSPDLPQAHVAEILQQCEGIDSDNAANYQNIPSDVLSMMDTAVKGIRTLLQGKNTPSPTPHPAPLAATPPLTITTPIATPNGSAPTSITPDTRANGTAIIQSVSATVHKPVVPQVPERLDTELIAFGLQHGIITASPIMEDALDALRFIAGHHGHVLIRGATGTGKELFSNAVHQSSARRDKPFIVIDGALVDAHFIKDDLVGHEKGAFTGADKKRKGKLHMAGEGVVFLDEIGRWPQEVQGMLLGILGGRPIEPLGSDEKNAIPMQARIVAATNADLEDLVNRGLFMEDLYYRLQRLRIELPTLQERGPIDIDLLAKHFLDASCKENKLADAVLIDQYAFEALREYSWPGNVRQMKHVMEQSLVNALREHARQKRLATNGSANGELTICRHHIDSSLETYRRLAPKQAEPKT